MSDSYDIFKAEVLSASGNRSIVEVAVSKEECFNCALISIRINIPVWIIRQEIVEKYFLISRKLNKLQGGVVLHLVDENGEVINY